jgi:hypothetical protein
MKNFTEIFKKEYYQKLLSPTGNNPIRNRADSLLIAFEELDRMDKENYKILETGCMRGDHGEWCFGDDGCATHIFDRFVNYYNGEFYSVDIDPNNVDYSRKRVSEKTNIECSDSVKYLYSLPETLKFDLVYLDSYDIERTNPHPSQLHHIKELCSIMKNLSRGTIIIVDDHDAFFTSGEIGKGTYVMEYLDNIGAEKLYEGYQIVYRY